MNSRGRLGHCDVFWPTKLCSLIFTGLKMLRDAVLDTVIFFFVIQADDCIDKFLMPVIFDRSMSWKNGLMLEAFIFFVCFGFLEFKCKGSVPSLQFGCSNLFKSPLLQSWMLGLLISMLALINYLLFLLLRTGTLRAHTYYFMLLRIIYEHYSSYKARGTIKLFQWDESFYQRFRSFRIEY